MLYEADTGYIVRADLVGDSLRDLKGKRVLTGTRESGARRIASQFCAPTASRCRRTIRWSSRRN